jgi:hypothetical protein
MLAPAALVVVVALVLFGGGQPLLPYRFPDVRPVLDSEEGWEWECDEAEIGDAWLFHERGWKRGQRPRAALQIHLNRKPRPNESHQTIGRESGQIGSRPVEWLLEENQAYDVPVRHTGFDYRHGRKYLSIEVQVWVCGRTEADLNFLLAKLKTLRFVDRESR